MTQSDGFRMIQRHARQAGIQIHVGNHSLRATGITECLKSAGTLENTERMVNHFSPLHHVSSTSSAATKLRLISTRRWGFEAEIENIGRPSINSVLAETYAQPEGAEGTG